MLLNIVYDGDIEYRINDEKLFFCNNKLDVRNVYWCLVEVEWFFVL